MNETITKVMDWLAVYGIKLIAAILIFVIGKWAAGVIRNFVKKIMTKSKVDDILVNFLGNLTYALVLTFVVIASLGQVGIQTTSLVAILGAAGLAVAFALQGSLSNFAAGVLLILFKPFKTGDYVEAGGTAGIIEEIEIFTTVLRTPDNKKVIVPNNNITSGNIINYSAKNERRVDLVIGVSYSDDLQLVKRVLKDILDKDDRVLAEPAPTIGVLELADSSINFAVRPWAKTSDYWGVYMDTLETVKERFDQEGISIPFPQQDIHLDENFLKLPALQSGSSIPNRN